MPMPRMRRIERPAQQPDADPAMVAARGQGRGSPPIVQGRT
jgi:hypothetical protein